MPNHVKNVIIIKTGSPEKSLEVAKEIFALRDFDTPTFWAFDFNKLIPRPESITNTESGSRSDRAYKMYVNKRPMEDFVEAFGEEAQTWYDMGKRCAENIEKYGAATWYEWSSKYWGTKWNAYSGAISSIEDTSITKLEDNKWTDELHFEFQTAWCIPEPVIKALCEKYPDLKIIHIYADEDYGRNLGAFEYHNGIETNLLQNIFDELPPDNEGSVLCCFAAMVWYGEGDLDSQRDSEYEDEREDYQTYYAPGREYCETNLKPILDLV